MNCQSMSFACFSLGSFGEQGGVEGLFFKCSIC